MSSTVKKFDEIYIKDNRWYRVCGLRPQQGLFRDSRSSQRRFVVFRYPGLASTWLNTGHLDSEIEEVTIGIG